jgi:hypothetical protein
MLTASPDFAQIAAVKTKPRLRKPSAVSTARWTSYAIAAGATAVAGMPTAEAEIHYSGLVNFKFHKESRGSETHSFPLSQGVVLVGYRYVRGAVDNSATLFMKGAAVSSAFRIYSPSFADSVAASLPRGAVVSRGPFALWGIGRLQDYACEFPDFQEPGTYYAGFRFNNGAGRQYGWVRIKWGGCSWNGYIVKDYAWGDPGDQIKAGQRKLHEDETQVAPQAAKSADAAPVEAGTQGSLGLLALGAVGLRAWRRSRRGDEHGA